jgi:hypothetical protein
MATIYRAEVIGSLIRPAYLKHRAMFHVKQEFSFARAFAFARAFSFAANQSRN